MKICFYCGGEFRFGNRAHRGDKFVNRCYFCSFKMNRDMRGFREWLEKTKMKRKQNNLLKVHKSNFSLEQYQKKIHLDYQKWLDSFSV